MFVVTKTSILHPFTENNDKLAECAAKIAIHNFQWSYTTLLLFNSSVISGVDLFLKLYKKTLIIGKGVYYPSYAQRTRQYIMFGTDILDIRQMLLWMKVHHFDNTGKYIITCGSQNCNEREAVDMFWSHKITNVVFLKHTSDGEIFSYTYFYPDVNCRNSKPIKTTRNVCANNTPTYELFRNKLKNLRTCQILVSTFIQVPYMNIKNGKPGGADGDLLLLIAEKLNASLEVMTPRYGDGWGKIEANGSWTGSLADILDDVANFSITSAALTISRFSYFQMSIGYGTVNVAWITHPAQLKPASLKLFHPFETLSQIVLAISFIFVGLCAWLVNSQYWPFFKNTQVNRTEEDVLFYSWMICIGLPSTKLPAKSAFLYMTFLWVWYCFLIRTFYQVCLISSLQGLFYYDQLDTIEEAISRNYSFGGGLSLRDYYIENPIIYDSWKIINTTQILPTLKSLSRNETNNFVLAMNLETAKNVIKNDKLLVRILPQTVINSPTVIFFKKFSPLVDTINVILLRLIESGFTEKIHKKYVTKKEPLGDNPSPITLEHYTGCYVILIAGWIVSTALFIVEIFYSRL